MIELARPGFLAAGALLALVPLALHFLVPRERERRPLPTLRFVREDARTRIRFRRRPSHPGLLALRLLLCLVLGAAFAGLRWVPAGEGTGTLIVVDGGVGPGSAWAELAAEVRERAAAGPGPVRVVRVTAPEAGAPVVRELDPAAIETLGAEPRTGEGDGDVRVSHLIRALRSEAERFTGVDSVGAVVATVPRRAGWGPGTVELRRALWPGRIELVEAPAPVDGEVRVRAVDLEVRIPDSEKREVVERAAAAALGALGMGLRAGGPVRLRVGDEAADPELWDPAAAGWHAPYFPTGGTRDEAFLLLDGRRVPGAGRPPSGTPAGGAVVPLLREGGRPAAAARVEADGRCRLLLPLESDAPVLRGGELALVLEALLREGCGAGADRGGWAEGLRRLLEEGEPGPVPRSRLRATEAGIPLTRLFMILALLLGGAEALAARSRTEPVPHTGERKT